MPRNVIVVFLSLGLILGLISQWPDGEIHVVACEVGQGDAILLTQGFSQVLVDGGPSARVINCLSNHMPFWDKAIELVVATHPDKDHIAGLVDVIEKYKVISFVSINEANETTIFNDLREKIWQNQIPVHLAQRGEEVLVGNIKLKVLSPEKSDKNFLVWSQNLPEKDGQQILGTSANSSSESSNENSVVAKATFGDFDVLLTGDITATVEKALTSDQDLSGIEVLKISHHGSKYATSQEFLEKIRPQLALIGVGKNQWGHPAEEVLERLRNLDIKILRTDTGGEIEVVSDGKGWYVKN